MCLFKSVCRFFTFAAVNINTKIGQACGFTGNWGNLPYGILRPIIIPQPAVSYFLLNCESISRPTFLLAGAKVGHFPQIR